MLQLESVIQEKTRAEIDQDQRDYYLREQMRVIQAELGDDDDDEEIYRYDALHRPGPVPCRLRQHH